MDLTHVPYRIVNFVRPERTKTNCCCATVVTKAITPIVSNRKWFKFPRAIGIASSASTKQQAIANVSFAVVIVRRPSVK